MNENQIKNYSPLQLALILDKRENFCRVLIDAAPRFTLYACKKCSRCDAIKDFFANRRKLEILQMDKIRNQYGDGNKELTKNKGKKEDVRAKAVDTQVNQMTKESVLHAFESTLGLWNLDTIAVNPQQRHHYLTLNHDGDVYDLSSLWSLFPDEHYDESSSDEESDDSDKESEQEEEIVPKKAVDPEEDLRKMKRRVSRLLKQNCDLPKQKQPLLHQKRSMTRYCESWSKPIRDKISFGAPETGADLKDWKMGSGKTTGSLQDLACRPHYDKVTVVCGNTTIDYWQTEIRRTGHFLTFLERPTKIRRYAQHVVEKRWAQPFFEESKSSGSEDKEGLRAKLSRKERIKVRSEIFSPKSLFHPESRNGIAYSTVYDVVGYQEFTRLSGDAISYDTSSDSEEENVNKKRTRVATTKLSRKSRRLSKKIRESDSDEETSEYEDKPELRALGRHLTEQSDDEEDFNISIESDPECSRLAAIVDEPQRFRNGTQGMKVGLCALQKNYGTLILTTGTVFVNDTNDVGGISCLFGAPVPEKGTTEEETQKKMPVEDFARLIAGRVNYYDMQVHNPALYKKCFPTQEEVIVKVPLTWKQTFLYLMAESQKVKFMGRTFQTSKSNSYGMRTLMICNKPEDCSPEDSPKMQAIKEKIMALNKWPQVVYCNLVESGAETIHNMLNGVEMPKKESKSPRKEGPNLTDLINAEQDEDAKQYMAALADSDDGHAEDKQNQEEEDDEEKAITGIRAALLTGKTPTFERQKIVDAFSSGRYDLLTLTDVGSIAIDLRGGAQGLHLSTPPVNEATAKQIIARIIRYLSHANCDSKHVIVYRYLACFPDVKTFHDKDYKNQIKDLQEAVYEAISLRKSKDASSEKIEQEVPLDELAEAMIEYIKKTKYTTEEDIYQRSLEKTKRLAPYSKVVNAADLFESVDCFAERSIVEEVK